ncbi:hypothetical protein [Streptomyces sedi]|uniref:Uncharacterized protein n=1 Tax=Streptomyces sedi TaxID=555059 RepID=A0A5C4VFE3_9ACTN|nr:hypothetical protein [Streptomyces sedi]TNM34492.1 hypothetical protein FH715_02140 [Streptomyces sedi]
MTNVPNEWSEDDSLLVELRHAAQEVEAGPVPVDRIVRRGRHLRARRRALAVGSAGAAGVLGVVLASAPSWWGGEDGARGEAAPPVVGAPGEVLEVGPAEPVAINDALVVGLLAEGRQNYVLSSPDSFDEAVEEARGVSGDNLGVDSISLHLEMDEGEPSLIGGTWRSDDGPPSRIEVLPHGESTTVEATVVALEGEDWGVYFLDPLHSSEIDTGFEVVAYDEEGAPFDFANCCVPANDNEDLGYEVP